jgi:hypothetical protein
MSDGCVAGGSTSSPRTTLHCRLRAYFFRLAALAWFIQPWALVLATSWVVALLCWRDSRSATLATPSGPVTGKGLPRGEGERPTRKTAGYSPAPE